MKGWVYVISNKGMPGLVKVGFSTKDPELRASELNHTGAPHPYLVDYEVLIDEPYSVEQDAHKLLQARREAKEWFKCDAEEAISAIKRAAGDRIIVETYKRAERKKAEELHQKELEERVAQQQERLREQKVKDQLASEEAEIRRNYEAQFKLGFPDKPFWHFWAIAFIPSWIAVAMLLPKAKDGGIVFAAIILAAILGGFLSSQHEKKQKASEGYRSLETMRDSDLASVRARWVQCPTCEKEISFDREKTLLSAPNTVWMCPACKTEIQPPAV